MTRLRRHLLVLGATATTLTVLAVGPEARADYPIVSYRYLADPGSLVYDGRVYLYMSNDDDNMGGYNMKSNVCVSSSDLKNWTDHGVVFQVPKDASWAGLSWAPQPVERNGTIYLYFGNNTGGVGVASSASPTGEFKDAKGSYLANGRTPGVQSGGWYFDPGVFIDDDGQGYLAFGGNGNQYANIVKLGSDLISVSGSASQLPVQDFLEASFLFKRDNVYYFSYSTTGGTGQRIDYLMSDSPMSGYKYVGTIAANPPQNSNNNQASEFEFNGKWYHAYHNRYVAKQAGIDATFKRNIGLEVLNFNADGTIQKIAYTTDGVPQVGTLNPYQRVEAETTNAQSGIKTETCSAGGMDVTSIDAGDWIRLRGVNFGTAGAKTFSASVAAATAGGAIELHLGTMAGTLIGTCNVPGTGGAQSWKTVTCDVTGATGVSDLYLKFAGGGFNFDFWQFGGGMPDIDAGAPGNGGADGDTGGRAGTSGAGGRPSLGTGGAGTGGAGTGGRGSGGAQGSGAVVGSGGITGVSAGTGGVVGSGGAVVSGGTGVSEGSGGSSAGGTTAETGSQGGCACQVDRDVAGRSLFGLAVAVAVAGRALQRRRPRV